MNYQLNISYEHLKQRLSDFENQAICILENSEITFEEITDFIDSWNKEVITFLKESISPQIDILIEKFEYCFRHDFLSKSINGKERHLEDKLNQLRLIKGYLELIDSLHGQKTIVINSIQDKVFFVLSKLHKINTDLYFSIEKIFLLNSIKYRDKETLEIADNLEKRGYATRENQYGDDDKIRLTIKGALYIERKIKSKTLKNKSENSKDLNNLLNDIKIQLEKLGYGQEVIFNELEELRSLIGVINKKNWGQLLKGKLIDLGLNQIINKEVASYIFETLTNGKLKLLE